MSDETAVLDGLTVNDMREQAATETERITAIRDICGGRFGEIEAQALHSREQRSRPTAQ